MTARRRSNALTEREVIAHPETKYWDFSTSGDSDVSITLVWHDDVTSGTFTVEHTDRPGVDGDSTSLEDWCARSHTITSPSASAAGCFCLNIESLGARRTRVKYVTAAASLVSIYVNGKD